LSDKGRGKHAFDGNGRNPRAVNEERSPFRNIAVHPLFIVYSRDTGRGNSRERGGAGGQPHAPAESPQVDQLVEIVKLMGTPGPDEIRAMNHNLADFPFPQVCRPSGAVKSLHRLALQDGRQGEGEEGGTRPPPLQSRCVAPTGRPRPLSLATPPG
jgi:hypothetical protein